MAFRIRFLAKLISSLIAVCKVIDVARDAIEPFVPDDTKAEWNSKLDSIQTACDFIRSVNYLDTESGTNAPWGRN